MKELILSVFTKYFTSNLFVFIIQFILHCSANIVALVNTTGYKALKHIRIHFK